MGCASWSAEGCQSSPSSEGIQMFSINFLSGICPQFKWTGTIKERKPSTDGRPRNWTFFGKLVMPCFIMQNVPPLVCLLAFKTTSPAFLSISKANWPVFGRQVTSVTPACTEELCGSLRPTADNFICNHGTTIRHSVWKHCQYYKGELCLGWKRGKC